MLDKDPALRHLIKDANLETQLSDVLLSLVDRISVGKDVIKIMEYNVFYLHSSPPGSDWIKGHILLLHDQTNTSAVWSKTRSLQTFAAFGYRCVAPDLPSIGRTGGAPIDDSFRANFINELITMLDFGELIVIGCSMAGKYVVPLLNHNLGKANFRLLSVVAVALSDTNKIINNSTKTFYDILTPCLVLRGAFDTSIGLSAADALSQLPNSRVVVVPNGKHLCYLSHPDFFHMVVLNFLEVVGKNLTKSIFVTEL